MSSSPPAPPRTRGAGSDEVVEFVDPLVARARNGDTQAWSRLYHLLFERVYRHACLLTGDPDLAEDIAQESFARAMVNLSDFRSQSRFTTWLHGIVLNVTRGHWRRQRNTATAHERLAAINDARADHHRDAPDRATLSRGRTQALYSVLQQLPETLRAAFTLREIVGLSLRESADQLGVSENNVAVRASRARSKVRLELLRQGWYEEGDPA